MSASPLHRDAGVAPMLLHPDPDPGHRAPTRSATYVDAAQFAARCDAAPLPTPPQTARMLIFGGAADDLTAVRRFATVAAVAAGLDSDRCLDVITAVSEAATRAIEHGGGRGALRCWTDDTWLVIEVLSPDGQILEPFSGHLPPQRRRARDRGMWLIRQLTDLVEIRDEQPGLTIRMHVQT